MDLASYRVWLRPDKLAWYPVRKAATSSFQNAWGGTPVDMRLIPSGIQKLTVVRSPFDRLASLWARDADYPPLRDFGCYKGIPWDEFLDCVCATREPYCDHHVWQANHVVPKDCEVFYFEDLENEIIRLNYMFELNLKLKLIGKTKQKMPEYTTEQAAMVARRYRKDLERFYENDTDPKSCRIQGEAKAKLRQEDVIGAAKLYKFRNWPAPTDSPSE